MTGKWQRYPFFLILLPVFFVFHGYVENYYFLSPGDCLPILGMYLAGTAVLYGITWWILKDKLKASLLATFLLAIYFFFGAGHDFLRRNNIFLHRYSLLLPLLAIGTIALTIYLKKKKAPFSRLPLFLNWMFLSFIVWDACMLTWTASQKRTGPSIDHSTAQATACDTCARPDIYLIVFDGYCNSQTLKDVYHYDNSRFDSFLINEGFRIQRASRSNYAITPFSMASILNYSYLKNMGGITFGDYADVLDALSTSRVVNFLYKQGYTVVNNSIFDLPGHPSEQDIPFIPLKGRLITNRTLPNYLVHHLGNSIGGVLSRLGDPFNMAAGSAGRVDRDNDRLLRQTLEESRKKTGRPRFVYTHLSMPHYPYLFDSLRRRRPLSDVLSHMYENYPDYYVDYLPYTNDCARLLINTIKKNTGGQAVILFMSDHGFRYTTDEKDTRNFFHNQNAMYFPDKDYRLLYDSMSAVNEFRVVFNKFFGQQLPLLKDSTIYLAEK